MTTPNLDPAGQRPEAFSPGMHNALLFGLGLALITLAIANVDHVFAVFDRVAELAR